MNLPCSMTYLARTGKGTYRSKTFRLAAHGPTWARTVAVPAEYYTLPTPPSASTREPPCLPSPPPAALQGQYGSAAGPTVRLLSRKAQGGIFPSSSPSPALWPLSKAQGGGWVGHCESSLGAGLATWEV